MDFRIRRLTGLQPCRLGAPRSAGRILRLTSLSCAAMTLAACAPGGEVRKAPDEAADYDVCLESLMTVGAAGAGRKDDCKEPADRAGSPAPGR